MGPPYLQARAQDLACELRGAGYVAQAGIVNVSQQADKGEWEAAAGKPADGSVFEALWFAFERKNVFQTSDYPMEEGFFDALYDA